MKALNNIFDLKVGSKQARKVFLGSNLVWNLAKLVVPSNEIWYTSTDGKIVNLSPDRGSFKVSLVSNTYENGKGVMVFDGPLTIIPMSAFSSRTTLKTIYIPSNITEIDKYVFNSCSNLRTLYCTPTVPPSVWSNSFNNTSNVNIYVPVDSFDSYMSTTWKTYYQYNLKAYDYNTGTVVS